jgi:hypothetical protein
MQSLRVSSKAITPMNAVTVDGESWEALTRRYEIQAQIDPFTGRQSGLGFRYQHKPNVLFTRGDKESSQKSGNNSPYLRLPKGSPSRRSSSPAMNEVEISFHSFHKKDFAHTAGLQIHSDSPAKKVEKFVFSNKPIQLYSTQAEVKPRKVPILTEPPFVKQNKQVKRATNHFLSIQQAHQKPPTGRSTKQLTTLQKSQKYSAS